MNAKVSIISVSYQWKRIYDTSEPPINGGESMMPVSLWSVSMMPVSLSMGT